MNSSSELPKSLSDYIKSGQIWVAIESTVEPLDPRPYYSNVGFFRDEEEGWKWVEEDPEHRNIELLSLIAGESYPAPSKVIHQDLDTIWFFRKTKDGYAPATYVNPEGFTKKVAKKVLKDLQAGKYAPMSPKGSHYVACIEQYVEVPFPD